MSTLGHETEAVNVQDLKASLQKFKTEKVDNAVLPGLTAGNVVGEFSDTGAEFAFRPSAGAVDIESGIADHGGHLQKVKGNTVPWNQQIVNGDFSDGYSSWSPINANVTVQDHVATAAIVNNDQKDFSIKQGNQLIAGHKYYASAQIATDGSIVPFVYLYSEGNLTASSPVTGSTFKRRSIIGLMGTNDKQVGVGDSDVRGKTGNIYVKEVICIDLTLIYGEKNEPSTPEAFEADYQKWFGKPLSYEEYDAGSLKPVKMTGIKTVGFNLYDISKEPADKMTYHCSGSVNGDVLTINATDVNAYWGWNGSGSVYQESHGTKIPVLPSTKYSVALSGSDMNFLAVNYDEQGNIIDHTGDKSSLSVFTTPSNCKFITLRIRRVGSVAGTSYTTKVNLNLHHSGDRDGEYEPYWESQLNVPITSLKGKLNGAGSSVVVFPDGMKKANSVYDEIVRRGDKTYAIKRVGSVDLGTLTWGTASSTAVFIAYFSSIKSPLVSTDKGNIICYRYTTVPTASWNSNTDNSIGATTNGNLQIRDASYDNDLSGLQTSLNGLSLFYELATPQEYLLDDFELPQDYDVDDWGTEEILLGENGCAPVLDLKYGINAGDTIKNLPHSYVSAVGEQQFTEAQKARARQNIGAASQEDMIKVQKQLEAIIPKVDNDYFVDMGLPSGILWAKRNIDLSQANGFAQSEYQYGCSFFSWGNTDGHNPISDSAFDYNFSANTYANTPGATLTASITPSFDAAHVNLGSPWRMPTKEDYEELLNSSYTKFIDASGNDIDPATTNKRTTMNGVVGIRLKSLINGNIIFFPCSGYGSGTTLNTKGSDGNYWSATSGGTANARYFTFNNSTVKPAHNDAKQYGFPIRPVM